jgi:hypothetical protein
MASPQLQLRVPETVMDALRERAVDGESLGLTGRWVIEQYLAIVKTANEQLTTDSELVRMILHDDDVRRGRITP